jgi:hypothetical protein
MRQILYILTHVRGPERSAGGLSHGFVKGMSTVSNQLEYSSFVLKSIEDGCQVESIYTDFSKAFVKVCHRLLLDKTPTDVEPSRCQWLGSYFSGRIQRERMADCVSQGSHLEPLCFIWFVNEIFKIFGHVWRWLENSDRLE